MTTAKCNREPIKPSQNSGHSSSQRLESTRGANHSRRTLNSASHKEQALYLARVDGGDEHHRNFLALSAIPTYSHSIVAARERALQSDLDLLRDSIWKYTLDKQKAPQSLDDLKKDNYIDKIPDDPMTHEPNWEVVQDDVLLSVDQQDPGVTDVHSASNATASDGTAYSSW